MHSGCELKESVAAVTCRMTDMMPTAGAGVEGIGKRKFNVTTGLAGGTGNLSASIFDDEEDTDGQCLSDTDPQQCKEVIKTKYEKHPLRAHRGPEEETSSNQKYRQECESFSDGI